MLKKYDCSKSTISRRFKRLKDEGFIKEHLGKSKLLNQMSEGRPKVYIPTLKGINYGGLEGKFRQITGGSAEEGIFRRFNIGLADMHGKLHIKIPINSSPAPEDDFVWKGPNKMRNGVKQYIRYMQKAGDRVTIEKFVGSKTTSITLKPRFISNFNDSPEDLIKRFIDVSWAIWSDLEMKGYELGFPEGPEGEAKFTLTCAAFEKIGYTESKNVIIDYSQGFAELHPKTGTLNANKLMAELLLDSNTIGKKFEKEIFSDKEAIQALDEVGEYSKMVESISRTREKVERNAEKTDLIAHHVGDLARSVNKLMNMLEGAQEQQQQQNNPPPPSAGGHMYG